MHSSSVIGTGIWIMSIKPDVIVHSVLDLAKFYFYLLPRVHFHFFLLLQQQL